jgi:hypothetical protein
VLWQDESGAGTGGCHAAIGRRRGDRFARAARSTGTSGGGFDRLPGVAIPRLRGAQVAKRGLALTRAAVYSSKLRG